MIDVYPTRVEARSEDGDVLFILSAEDLQVCTLHIKEPIPLHNANLEQVLTAVRRGVQMLGLED
jgi:hypothetical protein